MMSKENNYTKHVSNEECVIDGDGVIIYLKYVKRKMVNKEFRFKMIDANFTLKV